MSHDELLLMLFPRCAPLETVATGVLAGEQRFEDDSVVGVIALVGGQCIGVDVALAVAARVLAHIEARPGAPLVVLIDAGSQEMARRDELLGLNEYLAHLTKSFDLASAYGCRTVAILYGKAAAGAMIATAMATQYLVTVPGAAPSVMDLPSIAKVTKLPLDMLEKTSRHTPIFAPGAEPLIDTGAIAQTWTDAGTLAANLRALLDTAPELEDRRDQVGADRGGRTRAAVIAQRVMREALGDA